MKKFILYTLFFGCLLIPKATFAETSQEDVILDTTTTESSLLTEESLSSETLDAASTTESESSAETTKTADTVVKDISNVVDYTERFGAEYRTGDIVTPDDFKAYLEEKSGLTLQNLAFPATSSYTTATLGLNEATILAADSDSNNYTFLVRYLVKSNVATLTIWDVHYDMTTKILSGKRTIGAELYFYEAGLATQIPLFVYPAEQQSESFSFKVPADFTPGRLLSIIAYSPAAVEYSDPYLFKIPLAESSTTSTADSSSTVISENSTTKGTSKESLPKTGEIVANWLPWLGVLVLIIGAYLIYKKRKSK